MKLNYDCIRDILITVEDIETRDGFIREIDFHKQPRLSKYNAEEIQYNGIKLVEKGYLEGKILRADDFEQLYMMEDLSWEGHELLQTIRSEKVFAETKKTIKETIGSVSLEVFSNIASKIALGMLGMN